MTILFACSETSGTSYGVTVEHNAFINTASSRSGFQQGGVYRVDLPSEVPSGRFRFQRRGGNWTATGAHCTFYDSTNTGVLRFFKASSSSWRLEHWNGTAWVTAIDALPYNNNIVIPVELIYSTGVGGTAQIFINDAEVGSVSIGDSHNPISYFIMTIQGGTGTTSHREVWSELIFSDNERNLIDFVVETEAPTANSTDADGTGTFADIDEAINDSGATVLSLANSGNRSSFTSPARTGTHASGNILAVSVAADMRTGDLNSGPQSARFYLKIGGVRYYSPTYLLSLTSKGFQYTWNTNPSTGVKWTKAQAEAASLEWGIEAV